MVFVWLIGLIVVVAWLLGSVWGMLSVMPDLLPRPHRQMRKKSRLP